MRAKAKALPELVRRQKAVLATERRFARKAWRPGRVDCWKMASAHLKLLGWALPIVGSYSSMKGARRRLAEHGCATMADALDLVGLRRIAPAAALIGDLAFLPGDGPDGDIGALGIAIGNGALKVFHEDHVGLVSFRPDIPVLAAWSVSP